MSFTALIAKSRNSLIYLVQAEEKYQKRPAWYYVLVDKLKLPVMERKVATGLNIAEYGRVLYSGWGDEPPADVRAKVQEEYS